MGLNITEQKLIKLARISQRKIGTVVRGIGLTKLGSKYDVGTREEKAVLSLRDKGYVHILDIHQHEEMSGNGNSILFKTYTYQLIEH